MKKPLLISLLALASVLPASAIVISDFATAPGGGSFSGGQLSWNNGAVDQFVVSGGILTVAPVGGGSPTDDGNFGFADLTDAGVFDFTGVATLYVTARIDAGNVASGFIVNLFNSAGEGALKATFEVINFANTGFTTWAGSIQPHSEGGDLTTIQYFGLAGGGVGDAFRMSFDHIGTAAPSAIPEPSTYAIFAGLSVLGFVAIRRKMRSA